LNEGEEDKWKRKREMKEIENKGIEKKKNKKKQNYLDIIWMNKERLRREEWKKKTFYLFKLISFHFPLTFIFR